MIRGVNELGRSGFEANPRMAAGVRLAVYSKTSWADRNQPDDQFRNGSVRIGYA